MADAIDLSTLRAKKDEQKHTFEELSPEQQEALAAMAEENPEAAAEKATTAFVVSLVDGQWLATSYSQTPPLVLDHEPTVDDMWFAAKKVAKDIEIGNTAQAVLGMQQQMAMAMAQQRQAQQIAQGLNLK